MRYFQTLPSVVSLDSKNNIYVLKNLLARAILLPELSRNPMLMYQYTVQDGDTPESIAHKYYGDQYRYWLVLVANNIVDPMFDWPLRSDQFIPWLTEKYKEDTAAAFNMPVDSITSDLVMSYTNGTTHHYEKIITTVEGTSLTKAQKRIEIDSITFYSLITSTNTFTLPNGETVSTEIDKRSVSIYEYEFELNEGKRQINIIQSRYAADVENALQKLMS